MRIRGYERSGEGEGDETSSEEERRRAITTINNLKQHFPLPFTTRHDLTTYHTLLSNTLRRLTMTIILSRRQCSRLSPLYLLLYGLRFFHVFNLRLVSVVCTTLVSEQSVSQLESSSSSSFIATPFLLSFVIASSSLPFFPSSYRRVYCCGSVVEYEDRRGCLEEEAEARGGRKAVEDLVGKRRVDREEGRSGVGRTEQLRVTASISARKERSERGAEMRLGREWRGTSFVGYIFYNGRSLRL